MPKLIRKIFLFDWMTCVCFLMDPGQAIRYYQLPSLKLTAKAPENGWLEDDPFLFGFRPVFRASYCSFQLKLKGV